MLRRSLCFGFCCLMAAGLFLSASQALAAPSPTESLRGTVDKIFATLKNPDYRDPAKRAPLRNQIEADIRSIFDVTEFSRRTIASYWKNFSPDQQKRFSDAFAELLMATYLDRVDGYNGEQVNYLGERFTQEGRLAEVQTTVVLSTGQVTPVAYRMRLSGDRWRIYDVLIENVGLNSNYRSQFQDILAKSSPEDLINQVERRAREVKQQAANAS